MTDKTWKSLLGRQLVVFHKLNNKETFIEPNHFYYKNICLFKCYMFRHLRVVTMSE